MLYHFASIQLSAPQFVKLRFSNSSYLALAFVSFALASCVQFDTSKSKTFVDNHNFYLMSDDSVAVVLERLYYSDQNVREQIERSSNSDLGFLISELIRTDSANLNCLEKILSKYGYPRRSKVGDTAAYGAFFVIQHNPGLIMEKYIDTIEALALIGEAESTHAAMMRDRLLMFQNQPQIYGTQAASNLDSNDPHRLYIWPVSNPDSVDEYRARAGFETSIRERADELGAEYDPLLLISRPEGSH